MAVWQHQSLPMQWTGRGHMNNCLFVIFLAFLFVGCSDSRNSFDASRGSTRPEGNQREEAGTALVPTAEFFARWWSPCDLVEMPSGCPDE